jgi:hypothetical protein
MVASKQIDVCAADHADSEPCAVGGGGTDLSAEISCATAAPADARSRRQLAERASR